MSLIHKGFFNLITLVLLFLFPTILMADSMDSCPKETNTRWHSCFGYFTYDDNSEYVGEWENNTPNGQGTYKKPNGFIYVGEFINGNFNGLGTATWPDGSRYIGGWKDNEFDGNGSLFSPNGETKTGFWSEGKLQDLKNVVKPSEPIDSERTNNKNSRLRDSDADKENPSFVISSDVKTIIPQQAIEKVLNIIGEIGENLEFHEPIYLDGSVDSKVSAKTKNVKFFKTLFHTMEVSFEKDREAWEYEIIFPNEIQVIGNESAKITSSSIDKIRVNGNFLEKGLKPTKLEILARNLDIQAKEGFLAFEELEIEQKFDNRPSKKSYSHSAELTDLRFESPEADIFIEDFSIQSEMDFERTNSNLDKEVWAPFLPNFDFASYFSLISMATQVDEELSLKNINMRTSEGDINFERLVISGSMAPERNKTNRINMSGNIEDFSIAGFDNIPDSALPYIPNLMKFDITVIAKQLDYLDGFSFEDLSLDSGPTENLENLEISRILVSSNKFSVDIKGSLKSEPSSSIGVTGNLEINIDGLNRVISEFQSNPNPEMMPALPILLMLRGLSNADIQESSRNSSNFYDIVINPNGIIVNGTDLSDLM